MWCHYNVMTLTVALYLQVIQRNLGGSGQQVMILSVQSAGQSSVAARRRRRGTDSDLDVLVAVKKGGNSYYRGNTLRRRIQQMIPELESAMGLQVDKVCDRMTFVTLHWESLHMHGNVLKEHLDFTRPKSTRADSRFAPSQWKTVLLCNDISHWLGASLELALSTQCSRVPV